MPKIDPKFAFILLREFHMGVAELYFGGAYGRFRGKVAQLKLLDLPDRAQHHLDDIVALMQEKYEGASIGWETVDAVLTAFADNTKHFIEVP